MRKAAIAVVGLLVLGGLAWQFDLAGRLAQHFFVAVPSGCRITPNEAYAEALSKSRKKSDPAGVLAAFQKAAEEQYRNPAIYHHLAEERLQHNDLDGANRNNEFAFEIANTGPVDVLDMEEARVYQARRKAVFEDLYVQQAQIRYRQGKPAEARVALDKAKAVLPSDKRILILDPHIALEMKDYPVAVEGFRTLLNQMPEMPDIHYLMGKSLYLKGEKVEAKFHLKKFVDKSAKENPRLPEAKQLLQKTIEETGPPAGPGKR